MPDPRDELAHIIDKGYADRECARLLLEWVLIRKNQEFTQAAMDLILRDGCGPVTAQALQMIHEAGFPFSISAEVKRLAAGRPKGSKGKQAAKNATVDPQLARVVALLADPRNASQKEINNAIAAVAAPGPAREALRKRVHRRLDSPF